MADLLTDETYFDSTLPVPAARALTNFTATEVGEDEIVLFDTERMTYHTMNLSAFRVWQLCDGVRSADSIVRALADSGDSLPAEAVLLTIAELDEAGLVQSETRALPSSRVSRRQVLKLAAAGGIGGAVIPVISSITAPVSAQVVSCTPDDGSCTPFAFQCCSGFLCACSSGGLFGPYFCCNPFGVLPADVVVGGEAP